MHRHNRLALAVKTALFGLSGLAISSVSQAQSESTESAEERPPIEEVRVTGSRIRRIDFESANPVVRITAEDILDIGAASIQDVLSELPQNSGGSLDQQQVFGFTPAASGVDLRGAGLGRSLTLISGKRTPKYPIAAGGTDNFVDTANIPLGAVDRIEVLTTGASAIYGSDAMGGVVNIILKESYDGVEFKVKHGDTEHGGRETFNASLLGGTSTDNSHMMFFIEHETKEALKANQRNNFNDLGSDLAYGGLGAYSSYGVSIRDAYTNALLETLPADECEARGLQPRSDGVCGFNRADRRDLFPEMERTSALINFKYDFGPAKFYSRIDYTHGETFREIEPMPVADYTYFVGVDEFEESDPGFVTLYSDLSGSTARFEQATAFGGDFATAEDGVYYPTRRMIEFGNRQTHSRTDNFSILTGVEGEVGDWNWDVDWMFARTAFYDWNPGFASADLYFNYLASGESGRSVFDLMTPEEVDAAAYIPWTDAQSNFTGFSGTIDGEIFDLPAGPIALAAGFESYREWFYNTADTESQKGNILSTGGSSGEGARDYNALFTEAFIPIVESFGTTVALRYDDYSDFGSNVAPQISFEYRPIEELLVRALWAETFRAPDMQRIYGDPTAAFDQIVDPYSCDQQGGTITSGMDPDDPDNPLDPDDPSYQIPACNGELYVDLFIGPNAELEAETGENINFGVVYNRDQFEATIDYWILDIDNLVNDLEPQDIATDYERYADLITRNASGDIEVINATAQNLSFRTTKGIDFNFAYSLPLMSNSTLRFKLNGSYLLEYDEQFSEATDVKSQLEVDRVPDLRSQFSVGYDIADFTTTLYFHYISEMNGKNNQEFPDDSGVKETIDSQLTLNWSAGYNYKNFQVRAGINNLTDEAPPVDETDFGWPFFPQEYYNTLGRNYYISLSYALK